MACAARDHAEYGAGESYRLRNYRVDESPRKKRETGKKKKVTVTMPAPPRKQPEQPKPPRVPRRAAVTLTAAPGSSKTYNKLMTKARIVQLPEIGIPNVRYRKAITGRVIMEIPGKESGVKADTLESRLREVFKGTEGVRIAPADKEGRLSGLTRSQRRSWCRRQPKQTAAKQRR